MTLAPNMTVDEVVAWLQGIASKKADTLSAVLAEIQRAVEGGEVECTGRAGAGGRREIIPPDVWSDLEIWFSDDSGYWRAAERGWRPKAAVFGSDLRADIALYAGGRTWTDNDPDDAGWHDLRLRSRDVRSKWPSQRAEVKGRDYERWAREIGKAPEGQKRVVAADIAKREGVDRATVEREARRILNSPPAGRGSRG